MGDSTSSADSPDEHPLVGALLDDRYRIEALLGEGGMGSVFRARHLSLDRPVAVKVLHPRLSDDPHVAKRFDREALAVSKLDHPNCVQVIDFGTTSRGVKYLVMQFLDGQELRDMTGFAMEPAEVADLGLQILRALEHAHKRGLVHRDLKPENIFIVQDDDDKPVVKLVDFGIVKLLEGMDGQEQLTRLGMAFGTPTYMSPEQAAGGKIDARTDLYAVGVLLYELLTGDPPFDADEPGILLRMHILADPPPLPDTVPAAMREVVMTLLAKEAGERFQTARDVRKALRAAIMGEAASDEPSGPLVLPGMTGPAARLVGAEDEAPTAAEPLAASSATTGSVVSSHEQATTGSEGAASSDDALGSSSAAPESNDVPGSAPTARASSDAPDSPIPVMASSTTAPGPPPPAASESAAFVRSGGTVVASSSSPGPLRAEGLVVAPAPPPPSAPNLMESSSRLPPSGSMSASWSAVAPIDPGASSGHNPAWTGSGPLTSSGAHAVLPSGSYPAAARPGHAPRPRSSNARGWVVLVILLGVGLWIALAVIWMRDDEQSAPEAAPRPASPAAGQWRFVDTQGEAELAPRPLDDLEGPRLPGSSPAPDVAGRSRSSRSDDQGKRDNKRGGKKANKGTKGDRRDD